MNKNYLILGAIALGFLFIMKNKAQAVHQPISTFIEPTSSNNTTNYSTFGAQNLLTILD
jgi:hypothetical protein